LANLSSLLRIFHATKGSTSVQVTTLSRFSLFFFLFWCLLVKVIQGLVGKAIIPSVPATELVATWKSIRKLRLKLQCYYKGQIGTFQLNKVAETTYVLTENELVQLNNCLGLLHNIMSHFRAIRVMEKVQKND